MHAVMAIGWDPQVMFSVTKDRGTLEPSHPRGREYMVSWVKEGVEGCSLVRVESIKDGENLWGWGLMWGSLGCAPGNGNFHVTRLLVSLFCF